MSLGLSRSTCSNRVFAPGFTYLLQQDSKSRVSRHVCNILQTRSCISNHVTHTLQARSCILHIVSNTPGRVLYLNHVIKTHTAGQILYLPTCQTPGWALHIIPRDTNTQLVKPWTTGWGLLSSRYIRLVLLSIPAFVQIWWVGGVRGEGGMRATISTIRDLNLYMYMYLAIFIH